MGNCSCCALHNRNENHVMIEDLEDQKENELADDQLDKSSHDKKQLRGGNPTQTAIKSKFNGEKSPNMKLAKE